MSAFRIMLALALGGSLVATGCPGEEKKDDKSSKAEKKDGDKPTKQPEGEAKTPESKTPEAKTPEADAKAPEGEAKAPEGDAKAPAGDAKAPAGDAKPEGDTKPAPK